MDPPPSKQLTCRQWKLNPVGCLVGTVDCPYTHVDTGVMSPPSSVTCWAWKHGDCKYHPDGCLFAHSDTGILQTSPFSARHRPLRNNERAIAKAAALAGFDCSDIDRLMTLVNAVLEADAGTKYPDYYRGTSNSQSSFPPARFRHRKNVLQSYRDADNPVVPAFSFTPDQILGGMRQFGPGGDFMGFMGSHVVETTNSQTINLYNKRSFKGKYRPRPAKKVKTSNAQLTATTNQITIDLTLDDHALGTSSTVENSKAAEDTYTHPSRRGMVPGTSPDKPARASHNANQPRAENREPDVRAQTTNALTKISNILSTQLDQLAHARESLKVRWDHDCRLQVQSVTDDLAALNRCFGQMEDAGRDSLDIVQGRLLR